MARVVPPLMALSCPEFGGVAIGPIGISVFCITGRAGGICCASPAGIGISGGKGSVMGGIGSEGSGIGLGLAGSSVSPGIVCDPSGDVGEVCALIAVPVIARPNASAPSWI